MQKPLLQHAYAYTHTCTYNILYIHAYLYMGTYLCMHTHMIVKMCGRVFACSAWDAISETVSGTLVLVCFLPCPENLSESVPLQSSQPLRPALQIARVEDRELWRRVAVVAASAGARSSVPARTASNVKPSRPTVPPSRKRRRSLQQQPAPIQK